MKKHEKHKTLSRAKTSRFGQLEIALVGTSCSRINEYAGQWKNELQKNWNVSFVDADHKIDNVEFNIGINEKRIKYSNNPYQSELEQKIANRSVNVGLINGNHYQGDNQIVFIEGKKEDSLNRRLDQLTNIVAIVLVDQEKPFDFIQAHLKKSGKTGIPIFNIDDLLALNEWVAEYVMSSIPKVHALILAGGDSKRMGFDKSQISINDKPQEIYMAEMCINLGLKSFISKKNSELSEIDGIPVITDVFSGLGPFGAICSAFNKNPNVAWLVIACDLPLLHKKILTELLEKRNPAKIATCFRLEDKPFPEPLVTIYEPGAYMKFMEFLALGYSCPRKVLINTDVQIIETTDNQSFYNANSPADLEYINQVLNDLENL